MRRARRLVAAVALALLPAIGCDGEDPAPRSATKPAASAPPSRSFADASTSPVSVAASARRRAVLYAVGRAHRTGFVRTEFRFRNALPGYDVRYVQRPVVQDGSGSEVAVKGSHVLLVRMEDATEVFAVDGVGQPGTRPRPRLPGALGAVAEVVRVGGFEGVVTWAIGVSGRAPFRVRTADRPRRLLVDVVDW